jgi:hypothetical protein
LAGFFLLIPLVPMPLPELKISHAEVETKRTALEEPDKCNPDVE